MPDIVSEDNQNNAPRHGNKALAKRKSTKGKSKALRPQDLAGLLAAFVLELNGRNGRSAANPPCARYGPYLETERKNGNYARRRRVSGALYP